MSWRRMTVAGNWGSRMREAKWKWVVVFANGSTMDVPVASGARDARLQAMWMVKERTGAWPRHAIVEVQKHPTNGNGFMYKSYRTRG